MNTYLFLAYQEDIMFDRYDRICRLEITLFYSIHRERTNMDHPFKNRKIKSSHTQFLPFCKAIFDDIYQKLPN